MHSNTRPTIPKAFCWSRIGDESGESIQKIMRRKDLERQATGGLFLWGIGNGLSNGIRDLIVRESEPRVLFSPIRSAAAAIDQNPSGLLLWLDYIGPSGTPEPLPDAAFVTSRDSSARGTAKNAHYVLFCRADMPLLQQDCGTLRFADLRNLSSNRPVGFSQVTAVVSRREEEADVDREYRVVLSVRLAFPYYARLSTPVILDPADSARVDGVTELGDAGFWESEVREIKQKYRDLQPSSSSSRLSLFGFA